MLRDKKNGTWQSWLGRLRMQEFLIICREKRMEELRFN